MEAKNWYIASKSINIHDQGLVADENTGENIAVVYKGENAPLVAASPKMINALRQILDILPTGGEGWGLTEVEYEVWKIARKTIDEFENS
jgi:hypothetical protein